MRRKSAVTALLSSLIAVALLVTLGGDFGSRRAPERPTSRPSDWWFQQRAYPDGFIDPLVYRNAVQQARASHRAGELAFGGVLSWKLAGPANIGGRITALAVHPAGNPIYAGAASGGVFKSTDRGSIWTPIFDDFTTYSIGAVALDPTDPEILYVGTGESNPAGYTYDGDGLYRTRDGGQTWEFVGLSGVGRMARIAIHPSNPNRIYVAGRHSAFQSGPNGGVWRSEDQGLTWIHSLYVSNSTAAYDVVINPAHPETLFCSTWDHGSGSGTGIWRSADYGDTWTRLTNGLPSTSDMSRIALAISPSRPTTLYAQIIGRGSIGYVGEGMYRTTDAGQTWVKRDVGTTFRNAFGGFGWYFGDMGIDPIDPDVVYAMGVSFLRSTDGGATFVSRTGGTHVDQHAIWIDPTNPSTLYLGNDGGFYRSGNSGSSWTKAQDLPITQFYDVAVDWTDVTRVMGGTQDNGTVEVGTGPMDWAGILGGDGFYCVIDPLNPQIVIAEWQNCCNRTGPRRSTNGGATWSVPGGFSGSDRYNWDTPIVMDPNDHNVILVGSQRVYRSVNNGVSYTPISPDLTSGTLTTLDISRQSPLVYYAGASNRNVHRSTDGGGTWENISSGLPNRYVTRVTADPLDADVVYVSMSGISSGDRVFRSDDQGDTWTSISGNLPDLPVNDVIVDPVDGSLYAGTDLGVYATRDLGTSWFPLWLGMPFQPVLDLALHEPSRTLIAGTYGRSMWTLDLNQVPLGVAAAGAVPTLRLSAPRPNPSRGSVELTLELERRGDAEVAVFDPAGRVVRALHRGSLEAGRHTLRWDGADARGAVAPPGVYFLRATAGDARRSQRIVRIQ